MIYAIGDSFTYGDELGDPATDAWPSVLGNLMGRPVTNLGKSAVGNTMLVKKVIDVAYRDDAELIIIAWTSYLRSEFFDNGPYDTWPGATHFGDKLLKKEMTKKLDIAYDQNYEIWAYRNWLRQIILTQCLLESLNKKYLMAVSFHSWGNLHNSQDLWDKIDLEKFVGVVNVADVYHENFSTWTTGMPRGKGSHPLELGHQTIARKINEHIGN